MIGDRIRILRKSQKLRLRQFAEIVGTSIGYISEIENNISKPGYELIIKIKNNFNITYDWLLSEDGEGLLIKENDKLLLEENQRLKIVNEALEDKIINLKRQIKIKREGIMVGVKKYSSSFISEEIEE